MRYNSNCACSSVELECNSPKVEVTRLNRVKRTSSYIITVRYMKNILEKMSYFWKKIADAFFGFLKKYDWIVLLIVLTIFGIVIRVLLFDKVTDDFTIFLNNWYKNFYDDGFMAMGRNVGDYTPAYNYFLWFFSIFRLEPGSLQLLRCIKTISISFDYLIAIYSGLIVYRISCNDRIKAITTYGLVLFGLTIFINSSLWGQCDSIYASFVVMSFYYFMRSHHRTSSIMLGLALAFKLQAIFVIPFYIVMFLRRKVNLKYLIWIPLVYVAFAIPACFAAPDFFVRFKDICKVYFNQSTNSYKQIALNCSTLYSLIFNNFAEEQYIAAFSIPFAIIIIGLFIFFIYRSPVEFNDKTLVKVFLLFVMLTPFVLPHMHDRYYYIADVAIMIYVVLFPKKFYLAIMAILTSMIGYSAYLWRVYFINIGGDSSLSFRAGAIIYLVAICLVSLDLFKELYPNFQSQKEISSGEKDL